MNNFLKMFLAALLAVVVANILMVFFFITVMVSIGSAFSSSGSGTVGSDKVLRIELSQPVIDNPQSGIFSELDMFARRKTRPLALYNVINAIEQAAYDDRIEGILLYISPGLEVGTSNLGEIREALQNFKANSGKFIVSYADIYTQGSYYLSSVADRMYMNPEGSLLWNGLASNVIFYKGMLDKLGIQSEVIRHGEYKAAVEPFILDKMSPENREQLNTMLGTVWGYVVKEIATARRLDSTQLKRYASNLSICVPQDAVDAGMIDSLAYHNDMNDLMVELVGHDDYNYVSLPDYIAAVGQPAKRLSRNKVAVIYAEGDIVDASNNDNRIVGTELARRLSKAREDESIKAVVLRVNSPGGSALASDIIWHEMELLRDKKPVIVSMGNVAASGGYYISAPADIILATPTTITGSIGVFGLLFNAEKGMKDKLGLTVDVAKTNPSADLGYPFRALYPNEREFMQKRVETVYNTFVNHVAAGRNLSYEAVDNIGGGRVWSGVSAREIGLIDEFGGLMQAIYLAADRAGIAEDYRVVSPTEEMDTFTQLIRYMFSEARQAKFSGELGTLYTEYFRIQELFKEQGIHALMPYTFELN